MIDRGLGPEMHERRPTGVPKILLPEHPSVGGFGALALREHVQARWACWAARFVLGELSPAGRAPWERVLRAYLRGLHPSFRPLALLTMGVDPPWLGVHDLPEDIQRVVTALARLPPIQEVATEPLAAGAWCQNVPLWGNPLFPVVIEEGARPGLESRHPELLGCHRLRTIGDLSRALHAFRGFLAKWEVVGELDSPTTRGMRVARRRHPELGADWKRLVVDQFGPDTPAARDLFQLHRHRLCEQALVAQAGDVPATWLQAVDGWWARPQGVPPPPSENDVVATLVARLGWRLAESFVVRLRDLTVKLATTLQLRPTREARRAAHMQFVREALGPNVPDVSIELHLLADSLRRVWYTVKWENLNKEAWWRLTVDGIPLLGNSHMRGAPRTECGCGAYSAATPNCTPRQHHFWRCPVAQSVVGEVSGRAGVQITRAHLWLLECPDGFQQCVWDVIALAAISAMEVGRRYILSARRRVGGECPGALCDQAQRRAIPDFWSRLHGLAMLGVPRRGWDSVGSHHPILRVVEGRLVCVGPLAAVPVP